MAKQKFYAVRTGRKTGVFTDWLTAEKQVKNFPGAVFRSFDNPSSAWEFVKCHESDFQKKFFSSTQKLVKLEKTPGEAVAYTDGSFDEKSASYSYGVVILWKNSTIKISRRLTNARDLELRNVAGEIMGAMRAIEFAQLNKIKSLTLYHDYQGIAAWPNKEWKANLPLTKEYRDFVNLVRKKMKIDFVWVKGHSGDYYNEMVDQLAKTATTKEKRKVES